MINTLWIVLLWLNSLAIGQALAGPPTIHRSGAVPLSGELAYPEELSGVTLWRDWLIVCPDEGDAFNLLQRGQDGYEVVHAVGLLDESDKEIDMEGAASDEAHVYVVGSHSIRRTKLDEDGEYKKNRKRITRVRPHADSYSLYRIQLDDQGQLVEKKQLDLRDVLESDEVLGPFFAVPGKENGIDIEGVAVKGGTLFIGFRGPVLRGNFVPVVTFEFDRPEDYELKFVQLGGRGIRDLVAVEGGFLILAGPVGDGDGSYQLCFWNGEDCVPGNEQVTGAITAIADIATAPGTKPEGVAVLAETREDWRLMVVFDGETAASEWQVAKR